MPFIVPGLAAIPFGLFFMGFSFFWMMMASRAPVPFWLFGVIFFFVGFVVSFGGPIGLLMAYKNTEYMITDQRIIIQTGAIGIDTRFLNLDKIQEVYIKVGLIDRIFGTGTVLVTTAGQYVYLGGPGNIVGTRPSFTALKEPYEVQNILQEALGKMRRPNA
jgi:uncharacterized membrane protein YdbT with pleckstrin-like domain